MTTHYIKRGSAFHITDSANLHIEPKLPAGNYSVNVTPQGELYLDRINDFEIPSRVYGRTEQLAARIMRSFNERPLGTGALFTGEKGSGKSLLAKLICHKAAALGIPSIVINEPYKGDGFNQFVQSIDQPAVIFIDEFEKVYRGEETQQQMLTLLDGTYPSKKLFLLTCNDRYAIDSHLRNRPGRIYYSLNFYGLSEEEVRGYLHDNLINKDHLEGVVRFSHTFSAFNFDMLKALVEEMNRFDEPVGEACSILNANPRNERTHEVRYSVEVIGPDGFQYIVEAPDAVAGDPIERGRGPLVTQLVDVRGTRAEGVTTTEELHVALFGDDTDDDDTPAPRINRLRARFTRDGYTPAKSVNGSIVYTNKEGFVLRLVPPARDLRYGSEFVDF